MDIRYAFRMLARSPGFTTVAVLTLALGIGINTIVFTLYESVAWKPLPAPAAEQIVRVYGQLGSSVVQLFSYLEYAEVRDNSRSFASVIASSEPQTALCVLPGARPDEAEALRVRLVSPDYFPSLGVNPAFGRSFAENEAGVVVSHSFWRRRLHADPAILGKTIAIHGTAVPILGVAPESFAGTGLPPAAPDLWVPLFLQSSVTPNTDWLGDRGAREFQILARRNPGVSVEQASAELETVGRGWPLVGDQSIELHAKPATFFQTDGGEFETFTLIARILMVAVALVLLIGCVNLVNLLAARNAARRRELSVRLALGASRLRLIRQLCVESVLLGMLGGAVGLLLSVWASDWIGRAVVESLRRISNGALTITLDLSPDWRVFAYTAAVSVLAGAVVGIWPAARAARVDINTTLKLDATATTPSRARRWNSRAVLLAAQVASCLVLLAGAGLLFHGVSRSQTIETGFDSRHALMLAVNSRGLAATTTGRAQLIRKLIDRLEVLPEVTSVAWADRPPFLGHGFGPFRNDRNQTVSCLFNGVSDRYFETLGIPILSGRAFTRLEIERGEAVVIVSESAARVLWPGQDPFGHRVYTAAWTRNEFPHQSYAVIGVAKSVRSTYLSKEDSPYLYFPKPAPAAGLLLVRTRIPPESVLRRAYGALSAIHPNLPAQSTLVTIEQGPMQIQKWMAQAPALISSILGLLALLLAAVGIYGTVSYLVTQRTKEIGIHMALGARRRDVLALVLRPGLRAVVWGAGFGLAGAVALSTLLTALVAIPTAPDMTYGAGAFDFATFVAVTATLAAAALAACFFPARRASRVEPMAALRNE